MYSQKFEIDAFQQQNNWTWDTYPLGVYAYRSPTAGMFLVEPPFVGSVQQANYLTAKISYNVDVAYIGAFTPAINYVPTLFLINYNLFAGNGLVATFTDAIPLLSDGIHTSFANGVDSLYQQFNPPLQTTSNAQLSLGVDWQFSNPLNADPAAGAYDFTVGLGTGSPSHDPGTLQILLDNSTIDPGRANKIGAPY